MDRLRHAHLARTLTQRCGGIEAAAGACRVGKTQLGDYQSPHGEGFMPADVIFDLEAYCGAAIYSRALAEAHAENARAADLGLAACEATERVAELQREVRLATADGVITPAMRSRLLRQEAVAEEAVREVGEILGRGGG